MRKIMQLSPSVKLVFKVLEYKGLMTQKELVAESYLPSPNSALCPWDVKERRDT